MMTEQEAKSKWCPFARVPVGSDPIEGNHASNRWTGGGYDQQHCCIGSACMAWRWDEWNWDNSGVSPKKLTGSAGHCGLAGNPE